MKDSVDSQPPHRTTAFSNYLVTNMPLKELADLLERKIQKVPPRCLRVVALNPAKFVFAQNDKRIENVLREAEFLYADGQGISWASALLYDRPLMRVAGVDLAYELLHRGSRNEWRVYLLGGGPDVNQAAQRAVTKMSRGRIHVRGHHGFFAGESVGRIVDEINTFRPHVLLVGLGSPKQELWIHEHYTELTVGTAMGVGGTLDVLAGRTRRAPVRWRELGMEWLYRVLREPRRARRMLSTHTRFSWWVLRGFLEGRNG